MVFTDPMMRETASFASTVLLLIWQTRLKSSTTSYTMASLCSYFDNTASAQRPNPDRIILAPPSIMAHDGVALRTPSFPRPAYEPFLLNRTND